MLHFYILNIQLQCLGHSGVSTGVLLKQTTHMLFQRTDVKNNTSRKPPKH